MPIKYDHLMNFDIPEVRQRYGPRETALYALSVGMGQDPLDTRQLPFVGAGPGRAVVLPAIANVLGHPGFWLADPVTGADAARLCPWRAGPDHSRADPARGRGSGEDPGDRPDRQGRGARRAALLAKTVRDAATEAPLATCHGTTFLRGDGGFGGPTGPARKPHALPETEPDHTFETQTRPEQALLYRWNGDPNPLHLDPRRRREGGLRATYPAWPVHLRRRVPCASGGAVRLRRRPLRSDGCPLHRACLSGRDAENRDLGGRIIPH